MAGNAGMGHPANKIYTRMVESLKNPNKNTSNYVIKLKRKLANKEKIISFISDNLSVYNSLLDAMKRSIHKVTVIGVSEDETYHAVLLKELISLIANCCHFSIACSIALKRHLIQFDMDALRVLESGERTNATLKASMLRLLANLAEYLETARLLIQPNLIDRISMMINNNENLITDSALRTIRLLSKHRVYMRQIVNANVALNIGLLLLKRELPSITQDTNVLIILEQLCRNINYIRDIGRQLGQARCAETILKIIFEDAVNPQIEKWQNLILNLTKYSCDFRNDFRHNAIPVVVSNRKVNRCIILFLCYLAHDAWARKDLRTENGLPLILERLESTTLLEEKAKIIESLKFFIYDSLGLAIICNRSEVTNLCINSMNYFFQNLNEHKPDYYAQEDQLENAARGDATPARIGFLEMKHVNPQFSRYSITSPSYTSCPSQSPPSNYSLSPSPSTSPIRTVEEMIYMTMDQVDDEVVVVNNEDEAGSSKDDEASVYKSIIFNCIEIFSWQTHHNENQAEFLIDEKILQTFLLFLSEVESSSQNRLLRLFRRILMSRNYLDKILDLKFAVMATSTLVRQPCLLKRFALPCDKCFERARYGREILSELSNQTDNPFGIGILEQHCAYSDDRFIYSLLNGLTLLRIVDHRNRFIQRWKPIKTILDRVSYILLNNTLESIQNNQLLIDVFAMLSLLLSKRCINRLIGTPEPYYRQEFDEECTLDTATEDEPHIDFRTASNNIISIRTDDLSKTNAYFQGLIRHASLNNHQTQKLTFVFEEDKEEVDASDFLVFLHYLSGCREKSCVKIEDAKTCIALLHLSDKYSCTELSEELLRSNGPARRYIDGSNIAEFMPVILSSSLYCDRFGYILALVFLKFTNTEQQREVFSILRGNAIGVEEFVKLISNFIESISTFISNRYMLPIDF